MTVTPLRVNGADLSHYQDWKLDLPAAKRAGLEFFYHKATEGEGVVDAFYARRRTEAKQAGIPFGAYHFARPDGSQDAVKEAQFFVKTAKIDPKNDLRPMLDLETESLTLGQLKRWAKVFMAEVQRLTGMECVLYSKWDFGLPNTRWAARYNNTNVPPAIPWDIWQFSNGDLGVPNQVAGIGHCDLNTFRKGFTVKDLFGRPSVPQQRATRTLTFQHTSMQYSDHPDQMRADAEKIFSRKKMIMTGTEAGEQPLKGILLDAARKHGYRFFAQAGQWIAIRADLIKGGWETGYVPVLESTDGTGRHTDRGVTWVGFDTVDLGRIYIGCGHYLTSGRKKGDPNFEWNVKYGKAIGDWATEKGKGTNLVYYAGDQNISDKIDDTFFGAPLTSFGDELDKHEGTGHGPIDVIAGYNKDGRSDPKDIRVLDDREFPLNTDHYLVEAEAEVRVLAEAA